MCGTTPTKWERDRRCSWGVTNFVKWGGHNTSLQTKARYCPTKLPSKSRKKINEHVYLVAIITEKPLVHTAQLQMVRVSIYTLRRGGVSSGATSNRCTCPAPA